MLPDSCCSKLPLGHMCKMGSQEMPSSAHTGGCLEAMGASTKKNAGALGAIASLVGLGQVCLVVAACHLLKQLKRPEKCAPCW